MIHSLSVLSLAITLLAGPVLAYTITQAQTITTSAAVGEKVNINTASVTDLMTLNGVGKKVAEKIVEYRQEHGLFKKPEEIRKVEGIGGGLWERNKDRIVIK